jgi:hypothetical protein
MSIKIQLHHVVVGCAKAKGIAEKSNIKKHLSKKLYLPAPKKAGFFLPKILPVKK